MFQTLVKRVPQNPECMHSEWSSLISMSGPSKTFLRWPKVLVSAASSLSKPNWLWLPSQKGFDLDCPHRHKAYTS
jgi:hypothetical protein